MGKKPVTIFLSQNYLHVYVTDLYFIPQQKHIQFNWPSRSWVLHLVVRSAYRYASSVNCAYSGCFHLALPPRADVNNIAIRVGSWHSFANRSRVSWPQPALPPASAAAATSFIYTMGTDETVIITFQQHLQQSTAASQRPQFIYIDVIYTLSAWTISWKCADIQ